MAQVVERGAAVVPQLDPLQVVPDALIGIQIRRIAWHDLELDACRSPGSQERLRTPNRTLVDLHEQAVIQGDAADDRQVVAAERPLRSPEVVRFLLQLLRHIPGKLLVIWDGGPIHFGQPVKDLLAAGGTARGRLRWRWLANMKKAGMAETVAAWQADGVRALVWDNAPAHHAKLVRAVGPALVPLPPYSPELNPPERIFEEIRRRAEGHVWGTIDAKVAEVEAFLQDLAQQPDRVRRLAGWTWITDALRHLPPQPFPAAP